MISAVYVRHRDPDVMPPELGDRIVTMLLRITWAKNARDSSRFGFLLIHHTKLRRLTLVLRITLMLIMAHMGFLWL